MEPNKFPTEIIDLPSKGYFYPQDNILSSGRIEIKYMTAKEEDILTSKNLIQKGIVLDKLLQSLIVTPINYDDLMVGDKNAILYAARVLAYGKDYRAEIECPSCGKKSECTIDLSILDHKEIDFSKFIKGSEELEFELPSSKIKITVKLLRSRDERIIDDALKGLKKISLQTGIDFEITTRLKHIITSVNGDRSRDTINKFVTESLLSRDSLALRIYLQELSPDLNSEFIFSCINCGIEKSLGIPLTVEFFWPGAKR